MKLFHSIFVMGLSFASLACKSAGTTASPAPSNPAANPASQAAADPCRLAWFWCDAHATWHDKPCAQASSGSCCTERSIQGATVSRDASTFKAKFCPQCGMACGKECPAAANGTCARCGKPMVEADAVQINRLWCETHHQWHDQPCGAQSASQCCDSRASLVPVCYRD